MNRPRMAIKLPALDRRWTAGRKRAVVTAIEQGLLTTGEACRRYALSLDELAYWEPRRGLPKIPGSITTSGLRMMEKPQLPTLAPL